MLLLSGVLLFAILAAIAVIVRRQPYFQKYEIGERVLMPGGATVWPSGETVPDRYGIVKGKQISELFERGTSERRSDSRFIPVLFDGEDKIYYVNKIFLRHLK